VGGETTPTPRRPPNAAFDLRRCLEEANLRGGRERSERLRVADEALGRVGCFLRPAERWGGLPSAPWPALITNGLLRRRICPACCVARLF